MQVNRIAVRVLSRVRVDDGENILTLYITYCLLSLIPVACLVIRCADFPFSTKSIKTQFKSSITLLIYIYTVENN